MTGRELFQVRSILGISQASAASMMGAQQSGTAALTATDIATAENNLNTIANVSVNTACEKFFRPTLNTYGGI